MALSRRCIRSMLSATPGEVPLPATDQWNQGGQLVKHLAFILVALIAGPAAAAPLCDKLGFAGLLAACNRGEPIDLTLASGKPLYDGEGPVMLQSGAYYEINFTADGSAELAIAGPEFFRAIWMNEI